MEKSIVTKPICLFSITLVLLMPMLGACQKEGLPTEAKTVEDAYRMIVGEWEWERTEINHRGQSHTTYETPETENKAIQYVFQKNGTAVKIENGSEFVDYSFEIKSTEPGDFHLTLSPTDKNIQVSTTFLIFYNGCLILTNRLGSSSYYIRKN